MSLSQELKKYNIDNISEISKLVGKEEFIIRTSSAKTVLVVTKTKTIKIFPTSHNITPEITALKQINSKYIIDILDSINSRSLKIIVYETVIPLMKVQKNNETLLKMFCDISNSLYDIHSAGYTHGDVGIGNIGLNKKGNFVLYDFEDVKKSILSKDRFEDVEMFLEDLEIQFKTHINFREMISALLDYMREEYVTTKSISKVFLGKRRTRTVKSYSYSLGDLKKLVNIKNFC